MTTEVKLIDGFDKLTEQEAFNIGAEHILQQGSFAVRDIGKEYTLPVCSYLATDGKKCGASCFLATDEDRRKADSAPHGSSWPTLVSTKVVPTEHLRKLISGLQVCHDSAPRNGPDGIEGWRRNWLRFMKDLARDHNLDASILDKGFAAKV